VAAIADGEYFSVDSVEYGQAVYRLPCRLVIDGERLIFDLEGAPPQVPHIINSKAFIVHSVIVEMLHPVLAGDLPFTQALYDLVEVRCPPGTLVDSVLPAAIASAHMDVPIVVSGAAVHCLHLALGASPDAPSRRYLATPHLQSWGVTTWSYQGDDGQNTFVLPDGSFGGTAAGHDRDGIDIDIRLIGNDVPLELPDVEVYEATYPLLFGQRRSRSGLHGAGRWRSGSGCHESFRVHGTDRFVGNLMGQRAAYPSMGCAGGRPGVAASFHLTRADGASEQVPMQAANVELGPDEWFEIRCGSGGGFGDPLDRAVELVEADAAIGRIDEPEAADLYGVVLRDGAADAAATGALRTRLRRRRLDQALPPGCVLPTPLPTVPDDEPMFPLYPGVVQHGPLAIAEDSGAVLAVAPAHWTDGCPRLEQRSANGGASGVVIRTYLDPATGRALHVEAVPDGEGRAFAVLPRRWTAAAPVVHEELGERVASA
jgi:N-methylhydantoinase B